MTRAYLALGSNLGDRRAHLQAAVDTLQRLPGIVIAGVSRVYETEPVDGPPQGPYLNAVVAVDVDTAIEPHSLLRIAQRLEQDAGRVRGERFGPRTLDVDVLLYGDVEMHDPELTVPHPRMWERGFVLAPLRDVAPQLVDREATWEGVRESAVALRLPWSNGSAPSR